MRIALFALINLAVLSYAQIPTAAPNFAGTWKLKSTSQNTPTGSTTRREVGENVVITQTGDELTFVGTSNVGSLLKTNRLTFYSNGRSEENLWANSDKPVRTVTVWVKGVLRIVETHEDRFRIPGHGIKTAKVKITEEWSLSKDGKKLTQRINHDWFDIDPMVRDLGGTVLDTWSERHDYERK
jgi:hypothetical protein